MSWFIDLLVGRTIFGKTITEPIAHLIGTAVVVLSIVGACIGLVSCLEHRGVAKHEAKLEKRAAPATAKATQERLEAAQKRETEHEEMHNVIVAQPDRPIAPTSHARGCEQLRRAGKHPPACR